MNRQDMNYYPNHRFIYGMLISGLLLFCFLFFSAAGREISAETEIKKTYGRVLIVANKNKLNDPVILKVTQRLENEGNYVKFAVGTNLKGLQADKYGAIIIINFIEDKNKDRSVEVFADKSVQKKIVLLNAIGDYLTPSKGRITSKTATAERIAVDIVEKTNIILSNR